jgi:glutathione S-transferase
VIVVYAFSTPNSIRVPIALEELGLEYELKSVNVRQSLEARARVFEQLFFQVSGIGPAFGQAGFSKRQAQEQLPLVIARFDAEAKRTLAVLDSVLARRAYCSGEEYTIADIAQFGWCGAGSLPEWISRQVPMWRDGTKTSPPELRSSGRSGKSPRWCRAPNRVAFRQAGARARSGASRSSRARTGRKRIR